MHSTVTFLFRCRLSSIDKTKNNKIIETMRTLNSNQITEKLSTTKAYAWNLKRRYR